MHRTAGSSLIEALVALAVFAIGAAANATWMAHALATHARASRLVAAASIASGLEARMRVNGGAAWAGEYARLAKPTIDCRTRCDGAQIAAGDIAAFRAALRDHLGPAASGDVSCDRSACTIRIAWQRGELLAWPVVP
ncbi:hypothetical protein SAMN02800692_1895 [Luteibacter sp. UNC138MFCol5.1]|uniref:prepilin-type N-terminal cleavage/methylation domain-containing protein n=1 Tax=Luteibacter sp. UNC138MFCol5.1 TaxID=1502774 RepID=UPI0008B8A6B6|nr:prepilin-type N-terminal cleavage/methylation domain-containing protein [Luteibacter sp. UNC138MFCol5.1]SEO74913.1 hypothetical protein SAMN02800692_1895 [Luteibacter sp. UNC138MFCol5.1]